MNNNKNIGTKILVSDDNQVILRALARTLRDNNFTTHVASQTDKAIEIAKNERISLLVTDLIMPNMSGRELSYEIKKTNEELKTLFISGYTSIDITLDQNSDFLQKPFTDDEFLRKISKLLSTDNL